MKYLRLLIPLVFINFGFAQVSVKPSDIKPVATATVLGRATAGSGSAEQLATTGTGAVVQATSPVLVTPNLGTPSTLVATNATGTAAGLTAGNAGAVPVSGITGLGTGVATALAVNVGTAGAPVVNGGALGTPTSGVATNLTGTAAGLTAGTANSAPASGLTGTTLATGVVVKYEVATIAALKAVVVTSLTSGATANVLGYYGAADGGGGLFTYNSASTSTDNGGTIIQPSAGSGRWFRLYRDTVDVRWFGAKGDGTTDDTARIQAAWNALIISGGTITVSPGTYAIDGNLNLVGQVGINVVGASASASMFYKPALATKSDYLVKINGFNHQLSSVTLLSAVDASTSSGYAANVGLYVVGNQGVGLTITRNCIVDHLEIRQVGIGLKLGNYSVDAVDPDIAGNTFSRIKIGPSNTGVFLNGQNILVNFYEGIWIDDFRDYAVLQTRGGDVNLSDSYFGQCYDFLTSSFPSHTNPKVYVTAGSLLIERSRNEDGASPTKRSVVQFTSTAGQNCVLRSNIFAHELQISPSVSDFCSIDLSPASNSGTLGGHAFLYDNEDDGWVYANNIDVTGISNRFRGQASGVVDGVKHSASQSSRMELWASGSGGNGHFSSPEKSLFGFLNPSAGSANGTQRVYAANGATHLELANSVGDTWAVLGNQGASNNNIELYSASGANGAETYVRRIAVDGANGGVTITSTNAATSIADGALVVGSNAAIAGSSGGTSYFSGKVISLDAFISKSNSPAFALQNSTGTNKSQYAWAANNTYFDYDGSLFFRAGFGGTTKATLDASGNLALVGGLTVGGGLRLASTTIGALPSAATSGAFAMYGVTDALTPVIGSAVVGGGAIKVAVMSNGSVWSVFAILP